MKTLNQYFDHTNLKAEATRADIARLCEEAMENHFYAVCVNSSHVAFAAECLSGSGVRIASVVGFPLGACSTEAKAFEADDACSKGADEIDMVISVGALLEKRYEEVRNDIEAVVSIASDYDAIVKVILETCLLDREEIETACVLAKGAGAAFVKTSTGFSTEGATIEAVALMKKTAGNEMRVKASGGIRTLEDALAMIEAGADRLGASASCEIMKAWEATGAAQ